MLSISRIYVGGFRGRALWLIFIILSFVLLAGCQTGAQKRTSSTAAAMQEANKKISNCLLRIEANPAYRAIADHMPLTGRKAPAISQLADTAIPTDEEVKMIIAHHNDFSQCRARGVEDYMKIAPSLLSIFVPAYNANDLITVELIQRKITWGEANQKKLAIKDATMLNAEAELTRLNQELSISHQAELAQRQAVLNTLLKWADQQQTLLQNQQLINSLNRPVITNCSSYGNSVQCTTY